MLITHFLIQSKLFSFIEKPMFTFIYLNGGWEVEVTGGVVVLSWQSKSPYGGVGGPRIISQSRAVLS